MNEKQWESKPIAKLTPREQYLRSQSLGKRLAERAARRLSNGDRNAAQTDLSLGYRANDLAFRLARRRSRHR